MQYSQFSQRWFRFAFLNPERVDKTHSVIYLWHVNRWKTLGEPSTFLSCPPEVAKAYGLEIKDCLSVFEDLLTWKFLVVSERTSQGLILSLTYELPPKRLKSADLLKSFEEYKAEYTTFSRKQILDDYLKRKYSPDLDNDLPF